MYNLPIIHLIPNDPAIVFLPFEIPFTTKNFYRKTLTLPLTYAKLEENSKWEKSASRYPSKIFLRTICRWFTLTHDPYLSNRIESKRSMFTNRSHHTFVRQSKFSNDTITLITEDRSPLSIVRSSLNVLCVYRSTFLPSQGIRIRYENYQEDGIAHAFNGVAYELTPDTDWRNILMREAVVVIARNETRATRSTRLSQDQLYNFSIFTHDRRIYAAGHVSGG